MCTKLRLVLATGLAVLVVGQVSAFAQPFSPSRATWDQAAGSLLIQVEKKKPAIDKSCLMVCERWGDAGCLKWVMKCKGDPGYPKLQGKSNVRK